MPTYQLGCDGGHRWEVNQPFGDPLPPCSQCGGEASRKPVRFGLVGRAVLPPPASAMPQTWRGTYEGDRDYVTSLRRTTQERVRLEERHPEFASTEGPVIAHEGRYEHVPLRGGRPEGEHGPGTHSHPPASGGHSHTGPPTPKDKHP